jgi:hypothetical protein
MTDFFLCRLLRSILHPFRPGLKMPFFPWSIQMNDISISSKKIYIYWTRNHIIVINIYGLSCTSSKISIKLKNLGCAVAQAVSRWLPTAATRVRARVWSCGICGGQSVAGVGFFRVLRFPLPIFIPPIAPQSPSSISWGLYNRPEVAAVPSGLSPTPLKKS